MIYWPENCWGGLRGFWEANRFKVDWARSGLWQRRMKMVLLGRFALEAGYSSSMAEVLKAAVDWIESLEMEGGPSPFWERPKAIVGWRGHHASHTMYFLEPFYSVRPTAPGRAQMEGQILTCPQCFPLVGTVPLIFPEWSIKAVWKSKQTKGWQCIGEPMQHVDNYKTAVRLNQCDGACLIKSLRCSQSQFSQLYNGKSKNAWTSYRLVRRNQWDDAQKAFCPVHGP